MKQTRLKFCWFSKLQIIKKKNQTIFHKFEKKDSHIRTGMSAFQSCMFNDAGWLQSKRHSNLTDTLT